MKALAALLMVLTIGACSRAEPEEPVAGPGNVCGDPALVGERIGLFEGSGSCGIENAVRLREVSGIALSTPATITCDTARALKTWVETGVRPAVGDTGGGAVSLRVVAHYSCRSRNNQAGARLSEHSFGRAIDIAGIGLANGDEITALTDWGRSGVGAQLREMWHAAYRSGSYCRSRDPKERLRRACL